MPKCYSGDLRERVIEAVEKGASRREAAEHFDVSVSSAIKWLQRWHESKSAAPKPRGGSVSPLEEFAAQILALVAEQPDLTLVEIVAKLRKQRIRTSRSSLWRFLDRHDITLKKSLQATERQRADVARARRRWMRAQGLFDPARLVFIDETAVSTNMVRLCCVGAASARSAVVCPRDAAARARTPARRSLRGNGHRVQVYQLEMKARLSVPDLWWCPVARSVEAHDFLRRGRF